LPVSSFLSSFAPAAAAWKLKRVGTWTVTDIQASGDAGRRLAADTVNVTVVTQRRAPTPPRRAG
jgi:hypothetical protein